MIYDIVILTDKAHAYPKHITDYTKNVITEDAIIANALGKLGLKVIRVAWSDDDFDWSLTKAVLFRTTWDYFNDFTKFSNWMNTVSKQTTLLNSETIIRWNLDKHYLQDLKQNGVPIAETLFIESGSVDSLEALHKKTNWDDTVLKPCISGGARHTYRLNSKTVKQYETLFASLIKDEAMMLQPFQHRIVTEGEISMMVFNGQFTHAVLKKAKAGDFRVQDDYGGSVYQYKPTAKEISFALNTVKACHEMPLYARVDIFTDNNGDLALAELELIEPELWFRYCPDSAHILAEGIAKTLSLM